MIILLHSPLVQEPEPVPQVAAHEDVLADCHVVRQAELLIDDSDPFIQRIDRRIDPAGSTIYQNLTIIL